MRVIDNSNFNIVERIEQFNEQLNIHPYVILTFVICILVSVVLTLLKNRRKS